MAILLNSLLRINPKDAHISMCQAALFIVAEPCDQPGSTGGYAEEMWRHV